MANAAPSTQSQNAWLASPAWIMSSVIRKMRGLAKSPCMSISKLAAWEALMRANTNGHLL